MATYLERLEEIVSRPDTGRETFIRASVYYARLKLNLAAMGTYYSQYWAKYPDRDSPRPVTYPYRLDGELVSEPADYSHRRALTLAAAPAPNADRQFNAESRPNLQCSRVEFVSFATTKSGKRVMVVTDPYKK